jgi:tripartite-type tricarboxylate transporter receptor subunit TctC
MLATRYFGFGVALSVVATQQALAQTTSTEPSSRPIRIVVAFTPGGQPDITARLIGARLTERLKQQVVVDNRPGGGGLVGTKIVADATPDGHTLLSVSASHVIAPAVRAKLPYDTLKDFAGVSLTASACYVLVVPTTSPARTAQELVALARAKPGQLAFGSAGTGSGTHFAAELFKQQTGIDTLHVPYKGIPEAMTDTLTGRIQYFLAPLASSSALVRDGKLRALGVTSTKRVEVLPDVPTIAESILPGFRWDSWAAILAPAKTPRTIIDRLNAEIVRALNEPDLQQRFRALGAEPIPSTPSQADKFVAEQHAVVMELARKAGIKAQ